MWVAGWGISPGEPTAGGWGLGSSWVAGVPAPQRPAHSDAPHVLRWRALTAGVAPASQAWVPAHSRKTGGPSTRHGKRGVTAGRRLSVSHLCVGRVVCSTAAARLTGSGRVGTAGGPGPGLSFSVPRARVSLRAWEWHLGGALAQSLALGWKNPTSALPACSHRGPCPLASGAERVGPVEPRALEPASSLLSALLRDTGLLRRLVLPQRPASWPTPSVPAFGSPWKSATCC